MGHASTGWILPSWPLSIRRPVALAAKEPEHGIAAVRLACVAAEVGARFLRERIEIEPIEWLAARHALFDGDKAITACQSDEGFRRAVALHGMSLPLDVDPSVVKGIPARHFLSDVELSYLTCAGSPNTPETERRGEEPISLYSCAISAELEHEQVQIFCAMLARSPAEVRARLRRRYGPLLEDEAKVMPGFDGSEPLACALVSDAMAHLLSLAADEPNSALARGLDFQVEQRFAT